MQVGGGRVRLAVCVHSMFSSLQFQLLWWMSQLHFCFPKFVSVGLFVWECVPLDLVKVVEHFVFDATERLGHIVHTMQDS